MKNKHLRPVVLITTPIYSPLNGGASTYFVSLINSLSKDIDFVILTTHVKNAPAIEIQTNPKIFRIIPNILFYPFPLRYLVLPISLLAMLILILLYKPHLIHAHASASLGFSAGLASKLYRMKIIKDIQDMDIISFNVKLGNVVKYIATGTTVGKILHSLDIPDDKVMVYPSLNPTECKLVYEQLKGKSSHGYENKIRLLFVGTLSKSVKGVDILIEAFEKILKLLPNLELTMVGDGPDMYWCKQQIQMKNLEEIIHLTGSLTYVDTLTYIEKCDILILPSRSEANPRVILEAFQFGKPVIATNVGGISDILVNEYNGLLIDSEDSNQLAKAIQRLAMDFNLRNKLGMMGQNFLNNLPECSELHNQILAIYLQYSK